MKVINKSKNQNKRGKYNICCLTCTQKFQLVIQILSYDLWYKRLRNRYQYSKGAFFKLWVAAPNGVAKQNFGVAKI